MIHVDRDSKIPLIDQIVLQLAGQIQDGQLPPGTRLPSIRKLAATVPVSAATVVAAYDRLTARGLIEARAASGYFVALPRQQVPRVARPASEPVHLDAVGLLRGMMQRTEGLTPVGSGFLPEHWLEDMLNARLLSRVARSGKRFYAQPAHPQGYPPLREQLALKLGLMGIPTSPDNLLTTFGVTQGFDLICRALLSPGETVAVEEPAYFGLYAQLRAYGLKLVGVPRLISGPDLEVLEQVCQTHRPRLFFTQTLLHNPTGGSTDPVTAFRLLELARRHGFMIVEDDVCGDFHPTANPLRLAQVDRLERVIFLSSFSKVMSPALRVGYLAAAPRLLELFLEQKMLSVLTSSEFDERLVFELLTGGQYRKHLERIRPRLSHSRASAIRGLREVGLQPALDAEGGMYIWAALPEGVDLQILADDAVANGYLLTPGNAFFLRQPERAWLRFSAAAANDGKLFDYFRKRLPLLVAHSPGLPIRAG
ncbi:MAG: PLP-dependent aminotransferase family protein [Rhodocyclaceae bacterium]|nr:PLP-dependent aminotransferase family protein [Rhodocyclaceae bacterium]